MGFNIEIVADNHKMILMNGLPEFASNINTHPCTCAYKLKV